MEIRPKTSGLTDKEWLCDQTLTFTLVLISTSTETCQLTDINSLYLYLNNIRKLTNEAHFTEYDPICGT